MSVFTPTDSGAFLAGLGLNSMLWGMLFKLDSVLKLVGLGRLGLRNRLLNWMNQNKGLALLATETVNLSVHGVTEPASFLFAAGGTIVNVFMIFIGLPLRAWRKASC